MWYTVECQSELRYDSSCKHSLLGRKLVKTPLDSSLKQRNVEECKEETLEWGKDRENGQRINFMGLNFMHETQ